MRREERYEKSEGRGRRVKGKGGEESGSQGTNKRENEAKRKEAKENVKIKLLERDKCSTELKEYKRRKRKYRH